MISKYYAYVDGGCPGNSHNATHMFGSYRVYGPYEYTAERPAPGVLTQSEPCIRNDRFHIQGLDTGKTTNNMAEAMSMLNLFIELDQKFLTPDTQVVVCTDSQLIMNQILGVYNIKKPHLKKVYGLINNVADRFSSKHGVSMWQCLNFEWITGDEMKEVLGH